MAHDRLSFAHMERVEHCLIQLIGTCNPSMLPLMLDPAFDNKAFYDSPGFPDILPYFPPYRAVALSYGTKPAQGFHEFGLAVGFNAILDLDEDGTAVLGRLHGDHRFRPMVRGRQIAGRILRQAPAEC
jgi:hypothetical protein